MRESNSKGTVWIVLIVLVLAGFAVWWFGVRDKATDQPGENGDSGPVSLTVSGVGFSTPESVQYDNAADLYLVSNINGESPIEKNGQGFISQVNPKGEVVDLKWIDGEEEGVELNAPKGMALSGEELYVADIDVVRVFNRSTGEPVRNIEIENATFLNGLASAENGSVYVSDSGLTVTEAGFEPTGTDAVYKITGDQVETVVADTKLSRPNGLAVHSDGESLMVVGFGSNEVFHINPDGSFFTIPEPLPEASLDGLVWLNTDKVMLISSWDGKAVYRVDHDSGEVLKVEVEGVDAPADIGYDTVRNRLLIPLFNENTVEIRTVAPEAAGNSNTLDNNDY